MKDSPKIVHIFKCDFKKNRSHCALFCCFFYSRSTFLVQNSVTASHTWTKFHNHFVLFSIYLFFWLIHNWVKDFPKGGWISERFSLARFSKKGVKSLYWTYLLLVDVLGSDLTLFFEIWVKTKKKSLYWALPPKANMLTRVIWHLFLADLS